MKTNVCYHGNCLEVLKILPENSVDSIVTDPPYELGFMGKSWDNSGIAYNVEMWKECLRVLKPGGHLLSFSGTRTYHRMAVAIEDAGFEVRDMIEWCYGSGFPKSLNISLAIDKQKGLQGQRGVGGFNVGGKGEQNNRSAKLHIGSTTDGSKQPAYNDAKSEEAKQFSGWGTALKPAHEPICMARKPLAEKTVAENVLKYGTGGINIDESRVGTEEMKARPSGKSSRAYQSEETTTAGGMGEDKIGRFPANLIHDNSEEVRECFPESKSNNAIRKNKVNIGENGIYGKFEAHDSFGFADSGNASRFFKSILYYPKASKSERNKGCDDINAQARVRQGLAGEKKDTISNNFHPTVKPIAIMSYLIKMVTPKGGIVLEPFAGSGSTLVAAKENDFQYIGIELTEEYLPIIQVRTGCEIIKPEIINEENIVSDLIEKDLPYTPVVNSSICECGGKIKKTASGKCCEWCMKDY